MADQRCWDGERKLFGVDVGDHAHGNHGHSHGVGVVLAGGLARNASPLAP